MLQVKIDFFAALKDHFKESTSIEFAEKLSIQEIKSKLKSLQPSAIDLIDSSRVSTEEEILEADSIIQKSMNLYLLPPSSGG